MKRYTVSDATWRYGSRNSERNPLKSSPNRNLRLGKFRDVAQLVAHLVWDQGVPGSSPGIPTSGNFVPIKRLKLYQMVGVLEERHIRIGRSELTTVNNRE